MSQNRRDLAQVAVAEALRVRKKTNCSLSQPINVFDLCERLGVAVFFQDIPSMEGIYMPDARPRPAIVVSSLRPAGRKAMTCGHELGHHVFKHGKQWDELIEDRTQSRKFEPEEYQVDLFSAYLQMPKTAVAHAMAIRKLDPDKCSAEDFFALSTLFGVSYSAFVTHMEQTINLIGMKRAADLLNAKPKDLRASLLGIECTHNLLVVDLHWADRAIDAEVGDSILLPSAVNLEGGSAEVRSTNNTRTVVTALSPGIASVSNA
jgi:Zn-dependent peptidase ImmA (M78 family)